MIFANRKVKKEDYNFKIGEANLEIVDSFKYLGVHFSYNGKFTVAINELCTLAERAMYSLYKKSRSLNLPVDIQFNLFDKVVLPIMLYSCEVWGFSNLSPLENLHRKFCKMALKLRSSTPNIMIYGETGRFPLEVLVKIRMINYWSRMVLGKKEKLNLISYNICKSHLFNSGLETDWISYIHKILTSSGYTNWIHIEQFIAKHAMKISNLQNKPSSQSLYNYIV